MRDLINHLRAKINDAEDISHYKPVVGTQKGSNPGGIFIDHNDEKHYVKFYSNEQQARSEVAASKIYNMVGAKTVEPRLVRYRGTLGVASKWQGMTDLGPPGYHGGGEHYHEQDPHELVKHFHAGVLTKNWDTVGDEHDNLKKDAEGNLRTVDTGGSFRFRAMGGRKDFGPDIAEHDTLRNGFNRRAQAAFGHLTREHFASHGDHLRKLTHENVRDVFRETGVHDADEHAANVIARRDALLRKF